METETNKQNEKFDHWCILDLFGHQRTAGHVTEATIGGCAFMRIDVPEKDGGNRTEYYGQGAIYSMRPVTEELARRIALQATPVVSEWDVRRLLNPATATEARPLEPDPDDDDNDDDDPHTGN